MKKFVKVFAAILCISNFNLAAKGESEIDPSYSHYRTQYYQVLAEREELQKKCEELENQVIYLENQLYYTEQSFEDFYTMNGDMNFDGRITVSDVIMLYKVASGIN